MTSSDRPRQIATLIPRQWTIQTLRRGFGQPLTKWKPPFVVVNVRRLAVRRDRAQRNASGLYLLKLANAAQHPDHDEGGGKRCEWQAHDPDHRRDVRRTGRTSPSTCVSRRGRLRFCSVNGRLAKEIKGSPASSRITRKLSPRRGDDRVELALGGGEVQTTSCATYDRFRPR